MMTQEPQQPPTEPEGRNNHAGQQVPDGQQLPPQEPLQQPAYGQSQPPQWGQFGQQQQPPYGQPQQPQPQQPQWGQYGQPGMQPGFTNYVAPPKPGVIPLRPLGLGEILDGAFQAARRNGKAMFGSALIFQLATTALTLLVMFLTLGTFLTDVFGMDPNTFNESDPAAMEALSSGLISFAASILLASFLAVIIQMVLQGALVVPVLRAVLNRKTSFGQMWHLTRPRVGSLLLLAILYAVATLLAILVFTGILVALFLAMGLLDNTAGGVLGAVALALGLSLPFLALGVWIGTKVLLAPAAIVVENIGAIAGIKRSWQLTKNNFWRTFGTSLLAAIIAGVIAGIITTPVSFLAGLIMPMLLGANPTPEQAITQFLIVQAISGVVGAIVGAVTLAFQAGVMALIYVDLRMRRDGFDIALLKESETGKDDGGIPGSPASGTLVPGAYPTGPESYTQQPGNYGQ
ncbi:hypothetical protein [Arthrobacter sp. E3]|uniref:DUF7847 domain-containing protein n=1 Tax=Arthrobacter sp. E3 TaxID=517402 RepID=UPI001A93F080|nr:hypothetical protein [Arthrobacter sp. E3]